MNSYQGLSLQGILSWLTKARPAKNVPYILAQSAVPVSIIQVNAGLTWTLAANPGNGKTRITASGAHGLTTSPAVGKSIYITGWSGTGAAGFYNIATVVDANNLDIDLTYAAGLGNPTVVQANTEVTMVSVPVPGGSLGPNGAIKLEATHSIKASTNTKSVRAKYGSGTFFTVSINAGTATGGGILKTVRNQGATNLQRFMDLFSNDSALSITNSTPTTLSIDSLQTQSVIITAQPSVVNEAIQIDGYTITISPGA